MKLDLSLLKKLLVIDHPSKHEYPMISFIINECYKIGNLIFEMDDFNNIFITKNSTNPEYYPCVVCHMDCTIPHKNKSVIINNGNVYGKDIKTGARIGLGMDDTVGICIALQLLKVFPDIKVLFTTEEEIGFLGATEAAQNIEFFFNVSYMIQADRHGEHDLITHTNGIYSASEQWLEKVTPIAAQYKYSEEYGLGTDVGELAGQLGLSGVNISCGYFKHHTDQEWMSIKATQNCLNFMEAIIKTVPLDTQYTIDIQQAYYGYYNKINEFEYIKDSPYDYDLPCDHCQHNYDCMNCNEKFY